MFEFYVSEAGPPFEGAFLASFYCFSKNELVSVGVREDGARYTYFSSSDMSIKFSNLLLFGSS